MEMVDRGLYHLVHAYQDGENSNPVQLLADEAKLLGIVKRPRREKLSLTGGSEP